MKSCTARYGSSNENNEGSDWTDAHTGKIYNGGQTIKVEAPIEVIPVLLRDGKQEYIIGKI